MNEPDMTGLDSDSHRGHFCDPRERIKGGFVLRLKAVPLINYLNMVKGLDPILHLGAGIPFYILVDKDGVIVDFGEHLRPSIPETRDIIDNHIDYK